MPRVPSPPTEHVIEDEQAHLFTAAAAPLSQRWWSQAACRSAPPDVFFPLTQRDARSWAEALPYCERCPVRLTCLGVALGDPSLLGIWGGTDEHQRHWLRQPARGSAQTGV